MTPTRRPPKNSRNISNLEDFVYLLSSADILTKGSWKVIWISETFPVRLRQHYHKNNHLRWKPSLSARPFRRVLFREPSFQQIINCNLSWSLWLKATICLETINAGLVVVVEFKEVVISFIDELPGAQLAFCLWKELPRLMTGITAHG